MTRIVLADDHQVIREKLRHLLSRETSWEVVGEAADGREALHLTLGLKPDVLVIDLNLPEIHGLEVIRELCQGPNPPRIVVVSIHGDEAYVRQALNNGALAFVTKDEIGQHLLPSIHAVLGGHRYLSPSVTH